MNGQRRISGQSLTLAVASLIGLAVFLIGFCLVTYNRLSAIRLDRDATWRPLAELLDTRYRAIEKVVANGVDSRQIDMRWGERWRSALDRFRAVSGAAEQELAAWEVEGLLMELDGSVSDPALKLAVSTAISPSTELGRDLGPICSDYRQVADRERALLTSIGGRLLDTFLQLQRPLELRIAGYDPAVRS